MFAQRAEEDAYVLPSAFEELRRFMNLPPVTDLQSLFENPVDSVFLNASMLSTSAALLAVSQATAHTHGEGAARKALVFYPTQVDGQPLLQALPNDPRALNLLCHRQVREGGGGEA